MEENNIKLNEECKETKMQSMDVKSELGKMKRMKNINIKHYYLNWTADEIVDWISSLDDGHYECYDTKFRLFFNEESVDYQAIPYIILIKLN